ncbi:MAG: hypothetical protein JNK72_00225 [Myxococcales bacterium]|nr:hypothetical protein [Myxococcales bacterium]
MSAAEREVAATLREIADAALGDPRGRWVEVLVEVGDEGGGTPAVAEQMAPSFGEMA